MSKVEHPTENPTAERLAKVDGLRGLRLVSPTTTVTERPILFSAPMVRAILADRKTQTRRVVKLVGSDTIEEREDGSSWPYCVTWAHGDDGEPWYACPYGQPGDRLWVRASRLTLGVTSVRVERLHAITEDDARAEGCEATVCDAPDDSRTLFRDLWESINGEASWASDAWVWVVCFKRVEVRHG